MSITLKRIIKAVVFCVLAAIMVFHLTRLLTPKWLDTWYASKTEKTYYKLEKDSIDVLFMGSSGQAVSIDPFRLYREQGISSYNLNCNQQTLLGTYFWMKEALKTQSPDVIVVEVSAIAMRPDVAERVARRSYDFMNWSLNKLSFVATFSSTGEMKDPVISYLFPLYMYHGRWSELTLQDYEFIYGDTDVYSRGFVPKTQVYGRIKKVDYTGIKLDDTVKPEPIETNREALVYMIELCRDEGINLLLYKSCDSGWTTESHNIICDVAEEYGVPFLDLNVPEIMADTGIDYPNDAMDRRHMNIRGAEKSTAYMGKYLKENYELPDAREDPRISALFEEEKTLYDYMMANAGHNFIEDLTEYLYEASDERYAVIAAGTGLSGSFTEEQAEKLKELGAPEEMICEYSVADMGAAVFGAVPEPAFAKDNKAAVSVKGKLSSGEVYCVTADETGTSIVIDEITYDASPGIVTVVIYDTRLHMSADTFTILGDGKGNLRIIR